MSWFLGEVWNWITYDLYFHSPVTFLSFIRLGQFLSNMGPTE